MPSRSFQPFRRRTLGALILGLGIASLVASGALILGAGIGPLVALAQGDDWDFLEEIEAMDAADAVGLLQEAEAALQNEQFDRADDFLALAEAKGADQRQVREYRRELDAGRSLKQVEDLVADARAEISRSNLEEAEDLLQAAEQIGSGERLIADAKASLRSKREDIEAARVAEQTASSRPSTSGSQQSGTRCITVYADVTSGFGETADDLTISGQPGSISNSSNRSSSTLCSDHRGRIGGQYDYRIRFDNTVCSGRFTVTDSVRSEVTINVYNDCSPAGIYQY